MGEWVVACLDNDLPDTPEITRRHIEAGFLHHRADGQGLGQLVERFVSDDFNIPRIELMPLEAAVEAHKRSEAGQTRGRLVLRIQAIRPPGSAAPNPGRQPGTG